MTEKTVRRYNIEVLRGMLKECGVKNFSAGLSYMTDDVYCDWPYRPVPDMPDTMIGRDTLHRFFEQGQAEFAGLNYEIQNIFELLDPDKLIAEYCSHSRHLPSGIPYHNQYLGIFHFRDGKISYWREYLDPLTIQKLFEAIKKSQVE